MSEKALVTGAEGALGSGVVRHFLEEGAEVVGTYRSKEPPADLRSPRLHWLKADLGGGAGARAAVAAALTTLGGRIDACVHCVGGFRWKPIGETSDEDVEFLIDANLKSTIYLLRELVPPMRERGSGRIVLVGARSSLAPAAGVSVYAATKAAVNALVAALADELKDTGVNVNAVLPTMIDTPANRASMPGADFSKWVPVPELARTIRGLTLPPAGAIRGALIPVPGRL